ncbi:MAG: transaldolase [Proteobacteria bacterium]|nr:transaldolase [Pseudomonadota bacterium]
MPTPSPTQLRLGPAQASYAEAAARWQREDGTARLWAGDATLFTNAGEDRWLGWLEVEDTLAAPLPAALAPEALRADGIREVLLLGMGGSSLCPEVLAKTQAPVSDGLELHVLDSTVPAQVAALVEARDPEHTLVVIASKSGGTVEPNMALRVCRERAVRALGETRAGSRFAAITDPGSALEALAREGGFRAVVHGEPTIGGRFSALSPFGLVPAGLLGLDRTDYADRARAMIAACRSEVPDPQNPGVQLGLALGALAQSGRDKLTLVLPPALAPFGGWVEQLVAESTGKNGRGIVPVDAEALGGPDVYGDDRVWLALWGPEKPDPETEGALSALAEAGQPVIEIAVSDPLDLGGEFFRFELATAVAGAVLGLNPFDQPDVEAAKVASRGLLKAYEDSGTLPASTPNLEADGVRLYADNGQAQVLESNARGGHPGDWLAAHVAQAQPGDYLSLNVYLERTPAIEARLQGLRQYLRDRLGVATTLGFGPRFLHSTGQLHKGGPNSGVFLQIEADDARDVAIPGQRMTFGVLKDAQARGDFEVLVERGRRALRVRLGTDIDSGLATLAGWLETRLEGDTGG